MEDRLSRRRFLELSAALAVVGATAACGDDDAAQPEPLSDIGVANPVLRTQARDPLALSIPTDRAPLLIFITIDDLNDYVGFLDGYTGAVTPNLDALAANSIVYDRAYCSSPACASSRNSFLFGQDPTVTGSYSNDEYRWWKSPVFTDRRSLPARLRDSGYDTLGYGKVFHTHRREHGGAEADAWDLFEDVIEAPKATSQLSKTEFGGWGSFGPQGTDDDQPDFVHMQRALKRIAERDTTKPTAVFLGLFQTAPAVCRAAALLRPV